MALKGNATFAYTTEGGDARTLHLNAPLRDLRAVHRRTRFVAEAADRTARSIITVGSGVRELRAVLRYEPNPQLLLEMLDAGAAGQTLTYTKDADDTRFQAPFELLNAGDAREIVLDRDLWFRSNYEVALHLRRTDDPTFTDLVSEVILGPGETYGLSDDGTEITLVDSGGDVFLAEDANEITADDATNEVTLRRYGGSVLTES